MKKYLNSYGAMILYLLFAFGLDRIIFAIMTSPQNHYDFGTYEYKARSINWVIFAIGSFIYLYCAFSKLKEDQIFHFFQAGLGSIVIFSPILLFRIISGNKIFSFFYLVFYGAGTGALSMALTFVAGLGMVGLLTGKENQTT